MKTEIRSFLLQQDIEKALIAAKDKDVPRAKLKIHPDRMEQLYAAGFTSAFSYELRLIASFLQMYLFKFEETYNITVNIE